MADRVRYAVVGLGYIAQSAVLPAFRQARRNSTLAALVSDDPDKLATLGTEYGVPLWASYDEYDALLRSGEIDAVYLATPNALHRDHAERAARAGVHVLCEKPMAVTGQECLSMIRAAREGGVKLMVAYRLHFEPANLRAAELAARGRLGDVRLFTSEFTMDVKAGDIRLQESLGGGALYDIGIYCINAARSVFRAEPLEVQALKLAGSDPRFREVGEMTGALLRYPGERMASFVVSFGAAKISRYRIIGTKGHLTVDPGYEIWEDLVQELRIGTRTTRRTFKRRDQFAPELAYFSDCIRNDTDVEPSGLEGLNDVRIIEGLLRSAERGEPVRLELEADRLPAPKQARRRYKARPRPELYRASAPSRK